MQLLWHWLLEERLQQCMERKSEISGLWHLRRISSFSVQAPNLMNRGQETILAVRKQVASRQAAPYSRRGLILMSPASLGIPSPLTSLITKLPADP